MGNIFNHTKFDKHKSINANTQLYTNVQKKMTHGKSCVYPATELANMQIYKNHQEMHQLLCKLTCYLITTI